MPRGYSYDCTPSSVEARRASDVHRRHAQQKRKLSDQRLAERLAARNKVKSSQCLQRCLPFTTLDKVSTEQIVDAMEYTTTEAGEVLCREDEVADCMIVMVSGACDVYIGESKITSLKDLDVLGESALFPDATGSSTRSATVCCTTRTKLLVLHKAELERLLESRALSQECVEALSKVAERRRKQNTEPIGEQRKLMPSRSDTFAGSPRRRTTVLWKK